MIVRSPPSCGSRFLLGYFLFISCSWIRSIACSFVCLFVSWFVSICILFQETAISTETSADLPHTTGPEDLVVEVRTTGRDWPILGIFVPRLHMRLSMRVLMRFLLQNAPCPTPHGCFFVKHPVDLKANYHILVEDTPLSNLCQLGGVLSQCWSGAYLVVRQLQLDERNILSDLLLGLDLSLQLDQILIHVVCVNPPLVKLAVLPLDFMRKPLQAWKQKSESSERKLSNSLPK